MSMSPQQLVLFPDYLSYHAVWERDYTTIASRYINFYSLTFSRSSKTDTGERSFLPLWLDLINVSSQLWYTSFCLPNCILFQGGEIAAVNIDKIVQRVHSLKIEWQTYWRKIENLVWHASFCYFVPTTVGPTILERCKFWNILIYTCIPT